MLERQYIHMRKRSNWGFGGWIWRRNVLPPGRQIQIAFAYALSVMSHAELLRIHLANAGKARSEQNADIYSADLVVEFAYAPEGHTRRLDGVEACLGFLSRISTFAMGFSLSEPTIVSEGDTFVAEYHGSATFKDTNLPYEQDYVLVGHVEGGKIAGLREYYDPMRVLRAMGEIP